MVVVPVNVFSLTDKLRSLLGAGIDSFQSEEGTGLDGRQMF